MPRFIPAEEGHIVQMLAPRDITGAVRNSQVVSLKNYSHITIVALFGVTGATCTLTVQACDDFVPTTPTAIPFNYYACLTAAGDVMGAKTAAAVGGITVPVTGGIFYAICLDATELLALGFSAVRVSITNPGTSTLASVVGTLSGARFQSPQSVTAIA